ncbi:hypothetical protein [Desulforamulus ruminis]|uniref:TrbL/VirB6 plasmid conjugal transfer protein n=1 Tax=Desulforamulus ruminis (strain ATCC 23193 / DSM 2154 / NCIMB 8452 / DL) TaxID=696281 RepID=F6DTC3_DESRL|nr:hypothetical protein [Desulforamulus ruminis]AEG58940.1 hypothetical protein Desru_0655 [Desulforamulus ruminis DSM 2154]
MRFKKGIVLFLLFTMVFSILTSAYAMVGDEDALEHNLVGDIETEKNQEGSLFMPVGLSVLSTAPVATALSGPFGAVTVVTGAATSGLGVIADPKYAIWENWPMSRWKFDHADPEGSWGFTSMAGKAAAATEEIFANLIFAVSKSLTRLSINLCVFAFNMDIVAGMVGWIGEGMRSIFDPDGDVTFLMLTAGSILLMIYAVFHFLKGQLTSVLSAVLLACLAVGGVFYFIANAEPIIRSVTKTTDSVTGVFLEAFGSFTSQSQQTKGISDPLDRGLVAMGQCTWNAIIGAPWAVSLFGTADEKNLKLTEGEYELLDSDLKRLEHVQPGMRIDTLYLGTVGSYRDSVVEALARPNKKYLKFIEGESIDHGNHSGSMVGLSAENAGEHKVTAALTLFPAAAFFLLTVLVAAPVIFSKFMLAGLLLILPGALLAMVIPVQGWDLAAKYFKNVLKFLLTLLIYGLYLSLVLCLATIVVMLFLEGGQVGWAMLTLTVLFGGAAYFRKKFFNAILDSAQKGYSKVGNPAAGMLKTAAMLRLVRRIGLADMAVDFMDFRGGRKRKAGGSSSRSDASMDLNAQGSPARKKKEAPNAAKASATASPEGSDDRSLLEIMQDRRKELKNNPPPKEAWNQPLEKVPWSLDGAEAKQKEGTVQSKTRKVSGKTSLNQTSQSRVSTQKEPAKSTGQEMIQMNQEHAPESRETVREPGETVVTKSERASAREPGKDLRTRYEQMKQAPADAGLMEKYQAMAAGKTGGRPGEENGMRQKYDALVAGTNQAQTKVLESRTEHAREETKTTFHLETPMEEKE